MTWFEFQDNIMFLVKCFQKNLEEFTRLVSFNDSTTRAGHSGNKLRVQFARNNFSQHFYFIRIARLWNSLPSNLIDLSLSFGTIKDRVQKYLVLIFEETLIQQILALFIWFARVINVIYVGVIHLILALLSNF